MRLASTRTRASSALRGYADRDGLDLRLPLQRERPGGGPPARTGTGCRGQVLALLEQDGVDDLLRSEVLRDAHAIPVVHRDLKPDNMLICADGSIKLLDFGIAALLRPDITRLTSTGSPIGTCQYMPPEQIQGGQVTPQSGLYALGCLLYELLTGTICSTAIPSSRSGSSTCTRRPCPCGPFVTTASAYRPW